MLIDSVDVVLRGGRGGDGRVSFGKMRFSGPDGGDGGKGGDLYLEGSQDLKLLNQFSRTKEVSAEDGSPGGRNKMTGKGGDDLTLMLPVGTSVINQENGKAILELAKVGEKVLFCKGGRGGKGNFAFRGPENTTPRHADNGEPSETKKVTLSLRLIADFGLIGLPNAGKTSLLNELTNSNAKTANYAFTTLSPNLGVLNNKFLADIPGLIEGASAGRGLGVSFLKHIEKVSVLIHCISSESTDAAKDYETVRTELFKFNPELLKKAEIIVLTKSDLVDKKDLAKKTKSLKAYSKNVLHISIHDYESLEKLKQILSRLK